MNDLIRKLKSRRGESLMESLIAIMIFTLASIVLYSMVTTSADINTTAKEADETHQAQMMVAEQAQGSGRAGSVSLTLTQTSSGTVNQSMGSVAVEVYGGEDGALYAYYVDESASGKGGG